MAARMIKDQQQQSSTSPNKSTSTCSLFMARLITQRRTWVVLPIIVNIILFSFSSNILKSILSWYSSPTISYPSMISGWWPSALYSSVALGAVLGLLSMAARMIVVLPEIRMIWIAGMLLLTLYGKPQRVVAEEGRKFMAEITGFAMKILIKDGTIVAAICAILGYFAFSWRSREDVGAS